MSNVQTEHNPDSLACPVCRSAECTDFMTHKGLELFTCGQCATIFMHPLPTAEDIAGLYDDSYDGATSGYFSKPDKKMRRSRGRVKYLKGFVSGGKFLDIGCNGGFMVEAAREAGFEAQGLDLDGVSIAYAREHYPQNTYFHGSVEDFAADATLFDLAYCSEVIEHVPDIHGFVASIAKLVRPGGVLFLTTPDISHWRRPRDLVSWDGFSPPSHCIYFNPRSLGLLMAGHGFEVVKRRIAFKPGMKMVCRKK